ncbi:MAG: methyltransferase domain-containing protein [Methanobacteriota archaeon]
MSHYDRKRTSELFDKTPSLSNKFQKHIGDAAFDCLELNGGDVLLDIGTGTGRYAIKAAMICHHVLGIDISRKSLEIARKNSEHLANFQFGYGAFEEPCAEIRLENYGITKMLAIYSLHHLSDNLKRASIQNIVKYLGSPGRFVIGDLMFFEKPDNHQQSFSEVAYDGGETDLPAEPAFLLSCFESMGAKCEIHKVHPLAGILVADFI